MSTASRSGKGSGPSNRGLDPANLDTRQAKVDKGELFTLFWGVVGTEESSYLAVYQHASDKLAVVWNTSNDLARPALLLGSRHRS